MYKIDLNKLTPDMVIYCDSEDQKRACFEQIGWNDDTVPNPETPICFRLNSNKKLFRHGSLHCYEEMDYTITPFEDILEDSSIIIPNIEFLKRYSNICNNNSCSQCPFGTISCLSGIEEATTEDLKDFISICKDVFASQIDKSKIKPNMIIQCHTIEQAKEIFNLLEPNKVNIPTSLLFRIGADLTIQESGTLRYFQESNYEITPIEELMKGNE